MLKDEKSNKMSSGNIAVIMAPSLFHPKVPLHGSPPTQHHSFFFNQNDKRTDPSKQFGVVSKLTEVTRILIDYSDFLFTVPPTFLRQIRARDSEKLGKLVKEKRLRKLDPRRIKQRTSRVMPGLPETDNVQSTFFQQDFPQEDCKVIRVRLAKRGGGDSEHQHHKVRVIA